MTTDHRPLPARIRRLRAWLGQVWWAVPGSVVRSKQRRNLWLWHYQVWDTERKRWRTATRVLPDVVVPMVRAAVTTDRRFRQAHKELRQLSMQVIERERRAHMKRPPQRASNS